LTLDRRPFYQHVTSRDDVTSASRPQTLMSSSPVTRGSAADVAGSWSAFSGRTFPRRTAGVTGTAAIQTGRRRIAADGTQAASRMGRTTPPAAPPRSHSRSYSELHSEDQLSPPPPPPPPLDPDEPLGGGGLTSGRTRTSSSTACVPRGGGQRQGDGCSWTLDRHRSTVAPACTTDVTPRACVVDCRQTGYPVYDV